MSKIKTQPSKTPKPNPNNQKQSSNRGPINAIIDPTTWAEEVPGRRTKATRAARTVAAPEVVAEAVEEAEADAEGREFLHPSCACFT